MAPILARQLRLSIQRLGSAAQQAGFGHWSLFNLSFPQCLSFRKASNTRSTCRLSARSMPMRVVASVFEGDECVAGKHNRIVERSFPCAMAAASEGRDGALIMTETVRSKSHTASQNAVDDCPKYRVVGSVGYRDSKGGTKAHAVFCALDSNP